MKDMKQMKKPLIIGAAIAFGVGLVIDDVCLHVKVHEMANDIAVLATTVEKTEQWIETSSVQGKWNGYKRQIKGYGQKMVEKIRNLKGPSKAKLPNETNNAASAENE